MTKTRVPRWAFLSIALGAGLLGGAYAVATTTYLASSPGETSSQTPTTSPSTGTDSEAVGTKDDLVGPTSQVAPPAPEPQPTLTAGPEIVAGSDLGTEPMALGDSLRAYARTDGTYIAIDPTAPLPQDVLTDMTSQAVTAIEAGTDTDMLTATIAKEDYAKAMNKGTGHWVVIVSPGTATKADHNDADSGWLFWAHDATTSHTSAITSKETAIQDAQKWIAERPDPGTYELIITG